MMRRTAIIVVFALSFLGVMFAQDWTMPITVYSGDRSSSRGLAFGVDYRGTDCFDVGLDVPMLPGMPGSYNCYFVPPCTDGFPEGMDPYLTVDIRSSSDSTYETTWVLRVSGDPSPNPRMVKWNIEDLPLPPDTSEEGEEGDTSGTGEDSTGGRKAWAEILQIGARLEGSDDTPTWVDMSTVDSFLFSPGYEVVIHAVMVGGVDHLAPWVENEYPSDGASGILVQDSILFDIKDDVSGVDLSSVSVTLTFHNGSLDSTADITSDCAYEPIVGGYHFVYRHPDVNLPETTQVCVNVVASDLADPVHTMDTVTWCFNTGLYIPDVDRFPPYFEMWTHAGQPLDISIVDTVNFMDDISFNVRDAEFGVDISSLRVIVDGEDHTADVETTRIGMYEEYNVVIPPIPSSGWIQGMEHSIEVTACDFTPNCTTVTVNFYVPLPVDLVDWQFDVTVTRDGVPSYLTFGMAEGASAGYDSLDQIRFPFPGFYAYFPLNDPTVPDTMLAKDIRPLHAGTEIWEVHAIGGSGDFEVTWDPDRIPDSIGSYSFHLYIGHGVPGGAVSWDDMKLFSSYPVGSDEIIYFKTEISSGTGSAPLLVNPDPAPGATNVPISSAICFNIIDDVGVDTSSLQVWLNGSDVTDGFEIAEILPNGYRFCYDPPGFLDLYTDYEVHVRVSDIDVTTHTLDTTYTFTTGGFCGPSFMMTLTGVDSTTDGDLLTQSVTIGTDSAATEGYDPGIDFPAPPPIDFSVVSLNPDEEDTLFTMLTRDIRNNCNESVWKIMFILPGGSSPASVWLQWNVDDVPVSSMWCLKVGVGTPETSPETYQLMTDIDRIEVNPAAGEVVYIKYTTECGGEETYCVRGVVTDELTGDAIEGAQVTIGGLTDFTESDGSYEICGLVSGDYDVTVAADGYETLSTSVTISDADANLDLALTPLGYDVCGTTYVDGEPTGGVHIVFGPVETYSGTGGAFCVHLTAGTYEVTADYPGYPVYVDTVEVSGDMSYNINIEAGTFTVTGTASLDGTPAEGITITVDGGTSVTTDSTGAYSIDVSYGVHTFVASYPGYADAETTILVESDTTLDFNLTPTTIQICVNVTLEGADDNSGALVQMPPATEMVTPPSGTVCFEDMDWGEYTITVSKEYYATVETTITANSDTTIDITLPYFWEPGGLTCEYSPTARPFAEDETLHTTISWEIPTGTTLAPSYFVIYRDGTELDTTSDFTYNDYSVEPGETYTYQVVAMYEGGESPMSEACEVTLDIEPDPNELLVIDFDDGAGFADDMATLLSSIGVTDFSMTGQDEDIAASGRFDLNDYRAVFVVLGIRGDGSDEVMSPEMQQMLLDYIDGGGFVYICGPDFAQDYAGTDLLERFSFSATDGNDSTTGNVQFVTMNSIFYMGTAWRSDYAYQTSADHYVDALTPYGSARPALYANEDSMVVGVYVGSRLVYTSVYLTAVDEAGRFLGGVLDWVPISNTGITERAEKPKAFTLTVNPNPFNAVCNVNFDVPEGGVVDLAIYDVTGSRIATLYHGNLARGAYSATWNAEGVPTGVYLVKLTVNGNTRISRAMLIK